jgi:regulator of nucleoside diphosphate kinase
MKQRPIVISEEDRARLVALIELAQTDPRVRKDYLVALQEELRRARIVPADKIPADIITMNSIVRLQDLDLDEFEEMELVYPAEADVTRQRISILAPIGTAILGYRIGDIIEWPVPAGMRRLRVEEILFQPEQAQTVHR